MLLMPVDTPEDMFPLGTPLDKINLFDTQPIDIPSLSPNEPHIKIGDVPLDFALPQGWQRIPMRRIISFMPYGEAGRIMRAFHIAQWRRESVYCGTCGSKNADAQTETARTCPHCGRVEYPRIAPAIIVLITNDEGQILLAHNAKFKAGLYSLIAGFNEAGETFEQTVEREAWEETGLKVKDICYKISQPWPFPCSLMTGWTARNAARSAARNAGGGGDLLPDGIEIEDARWFKRDALPELPGNGSVARQLIERWITGSL
jgi:NAD+ diphosphatase